MPNTADPRHRNEIFDAATVGTYLIGYAARLKIALEDVNQAMLANACAAIEGASSAGRRVFSVGNGGSAAISDHLCCDLTKGTHVPGHPIVDATSLTANVALYSALANDFGFEEVFARQLAFIAKEGDVLLAISSSGRSPNILAAVAMAREKGLTTIGLSGFAGGDLRHNADISLHVDVANYGIVEDAHQALMHIMAQFIACRRDNVGSTQQGGLK